MLGSPNGPAGPGSAASASWSVYAGRLRRATGEWLPSAVYVGHRPTFYDNEAATMLEVHCLGWAGDLYDEDVAVTFVERIRGDARFDSIDELAAQSRIDCDDAATALERDDREQNS